MKKFIVFPNFGAAIHLQATSMTATSNSLRFWKGKQLIAIFDSSEISKAGEESVFPDQKLDGAELSVERLNGYLDTLPSKSQN